MSAHGEKRRTSRRSVSLPVNFECGGTTHREYIKDISAGGAYIITNKQVQPGTKVNLKVSVPPAALPCRISGEVIRIDRFSHNRRVCIPPGIGIRFDDVSPEYAGRIQEFVANNKISALPEFKIHFEPRFCYLFAADCSIGCDNGCIYCHFAEASKAEHKLLDATTAVPVDITSLYTLTNIPSPIFLSPSSDPFAGANKDLTHEVLSYLLPKGIEFIILTKCVIPPATLKLIEKYKDQFEGIGIGITNLDAERNKVIEPRCPSANERLKGLKDLVQTGVKNVRLRMDPMFPLVDDNDDNLLSMVQTAADLKVYGITATYIFSFGNFIRRFNREPLLKESVKCINEKNPLQGGVALTVPLDQKIKVYDKLFALCQARGIDFSTCGCKESRLREMGYSLTCRNPDFYSRG